MNSFKQYPSHMKSQNNFKFLKKWKMGIVRKIWGFLYQFLYKTIFYKKWLLYSRSKITRITVIEVTLSLEAEHKRFYLMTCSKKLFSNKWRTIYAWIQQFIILLHYLWSGRLVKCYHLTHFLYQQTLPFLMMKHQNGQCLPV